MPILRPLAEPRGGIVTVPEHPAKFSRAIIDRLRTMLAPEVARVGLVRVLDPFAGTGGVHQLAEANVETYGVEIQGEWAAAHPDTICGSVLELPSIFPVGTFDVMVTSPCYGSRMADSHDAKDPCRTCGGTAAVHNPNAPDNIDEVCSACKGSGLTHRNTYAHALRRSGVEPVAGPENSALMQWGGPYRQFHREAWAACKKVVRPGGLVLLNVKNHLRTRRRGEPAEVQRVVEFHLNEWLVLGATLEEARRIETRGLAYGANHDVRVPAELILALRLPA